MKNKTKDAARKGINWVSWIALSVALIGGVPGFIGIIDYFNRTSIKIIFNKEQSIACRIDTSNKILKNKLAILLYRVTITGGGLQPAYIRDINLAIRLNNNWVQGKRFTPKQFDTTNKMGITKKFISMRHRTTHDRLNAIGWNPFVPGQKGLQHGEPDSFSFASYFDIDEKDFDKWDQLKIVVLDYLGHEYEDIIDITSLMKVGLRTIDLIQDG